eukprot:SAG22_NODE_1327_length_4730_cov_3.576549_2_plen_106_part_00
MLLRVTISSFAAVVRANYLVDGIPGRVTSEFLFTPAERCDFADNYGRLGLRLKVLGVLLTTGRVAGGLASAGFVLVSSYVRASLGPQRSSSCCDACWQQYREMGV